MGLTVNDIGKKQKNFSGKSPDGDLMATRN